MTVCCLMLARRRREDMLRSNRYYLTFIIQRCQRSVHYLSIIPTKTYDFLHQAAKVTSTQSAQNRGFTEDTLKRKNRIFQFKSRHSDQSQAPQMAKLRCLRCFSFCPNWGLVFVWSLFPEKRFSEGFSAPSLMIRERAALLYYPDPILKIILPFCADMV